ncbi:MAG: hypothetical protein R3F20_01200 [Planctomycetota bacterium]
MTDPTPQPTATRPRRRLVVASLVGLFALLALTAAAFDRLGRLSAPQRARSEMRVARSRCGELTEAIRAWESHRGQEIPPDRILDAMIEEKRLDPRKLADPWGNRYVVTRRPDGFPTVHSRGPDGRDGTADDLRTGR